MENNRTGVQWEPRKVLVSELIPYEKNPRKISATEFERLKDSIVEDGYHQRIIVTPDLRVIGGHQRIKALTELGFTEVEVLVPDRELTEEQFNRILVRDNVEYGIWDIDGVGDLMPVADLIALGVDEKTTKKLCQVELVGGQDPDDVPEIAEQPFSRRGDVWLCGGHRVVCGDATDPADIALALGGRQADMLLTDPPYNVNYEGKTKDALKIEGDKQADDIFRQFLERAFNQAQTGMKAGAAFYIWHASSEAANFYVAAKDSGLGVRQCLIWVKNSMVMGRRDYHWRHEPCLYGWKDGAAHKWQADRRQTTVLEFDRPTKNQEHPTMKPVELFKYLLGNSSIPDDLVLDPFLGSGTTIIAAHAMGRVACGTEIDPRYVDVIVRRWQKFSGMIARREHDGAEMPNE